MSGHFILLTGKVRSPPIRKENAMRKKSGFTLVEIMIVVAIIGLLAAIAIPSFVKARTQAQTTACINNLRQIDGAKQQWAMEAHASTGAVTVSEVNAYIKDGTPTCPASGTYAYNNLAVDPTCTVSGHAL
jgi:prepilin-type N-terminal cleavage/methylation domain-containing protein